jgi:PAS domain-containing protein
MSRERPGVKCLIGSTGFTASNGGTGIGALLLMARVTSEHDEAWGHLQDGGRASCAVGVTQRADSTLIALLHAAPDAMLVIDEAGLIVLANAQAWQPFGPHGEEPAHPSNGSFPLRIRSSDRMPQACRWWAEDARVEVLDRNVLSCLQFGSWRSTTSRWSFGLGRRFNFPRLSRA